VTTFSIFYSEAGQEKEIALLQTSNQLYVSVNEIKERGYFMDPDGSRIIPWHAITRIVRSQVQQQPEGWFFLDEVGQECGPYPTVRAAQAALSEYMKTL
jgi:hypothetical protein